MTVRNAIYDQDLGQRKEIVLGLLAWLSAGEQKAFLTWCCGQLASIYRGTRIDGPIIGGAKESWVHLVMLCTQLGLDFEVARAELERRVQRARPQREARRMLLIPGVPGAIKGD